MRNIRVIKAVFSAAVIAVLVTSCGRAESNVGEAGGRTSYKQTDISEPNEAERYVPYEIKAGDYRISFDYTEGYERTEDDWLPADDGVELSLDNKNRLYVLVSSSDSIYNRNNQASATEFINKTNADYPNGKVWAEDLEAGDFQGYVYRNIAKTSHNGKNYTPGNMGYMLFNGTDCISIYSWSLSSLPVDIKNLRIERA